MSAAARDLVVSPERARSARSPARPRVQPKPLAIHKRRVARLLGLGLILGSAGLVVVGRAVVGSEQFKLDILRQQLDEARIANEELRLEAADLIAPGRIIPIAERELGMVPAANPIYIQASSSPSGPGA